MIRVLAVDDHPALQAGLLTVLRGEPGIVPCGAVGTAADALAGMERDPDVVLVDYQLPDEDGLELCRRLKLLAEPPRVLIYSAHADARLVIPARLAGADGMVDKGAPADLLFEAIRTVAKGGTVFPPPGRDLLEESGELVEAGDLPILGMLLEGVAPAEAAEALGLEREALDARIERMVKALRPHGIPPS